MGEKTMTPEETENLRIEKLKEIIEVRNQINTIEVEKNRLEKELVLLKENVRQAKHNLNVKLIEERILHSEFWKAKQ